jgi:O-antigen/teichoic acid export membrane protein
MGQYFLFWAIAGGSIILIDLGVSNALEKRVSEATNQSRISGAASMISAGILLISSGLIYYFKSNLNHYIGAPLSKLLIVLLIVRQGATLMKKLLSAELRVGQTAILRLTRRVIFVFSGVIFINYGVDGAKALVYGQIIGYTVIGVWAWKRKSTTISWPKKSEFKSLFEFSRYGFLTDAGGYLYNWTDILVIGFFLQQSATGAYEMSWRVAGVVMIASNAIHLTMFPQISRWDATGNLSRIESLIQKIIFPSVVLVIPAFVGVSILSYDILKTLFSPEYTIASTALVILFASKLIQSVHVLFERTLSAIDRPDLTAIAMGSSMIINILLNLILVPVAGLSGAAMATTIASLINLILHYKFLSSIIAIRIPARRLMWCVVSSVVMGIILYLIKLSITVSSIFDLGSIIGICALLYALFLILSQDIRHDILVGIKKIV